MSIAVPTVKVVFDVVICILFFSSSLCCCAINQILMTKCKHDKNIWKGGFTLSKQEHTVWESKCVLIVTDRC